MDLGHITVRAQERCASLTIRSAMTSVRPTTTATATMTSAVLPRASVSAATRHSARTRRCPVQTPVDIVTRAGALHGSVTCI